jgi:glycosyltransferase involved in cell wall biosynthesis
VKISVVMATYNATSILPGALAAVAAQRHPEIELLVADGGSSDGTAALLAAHRESIAWWVSEPDHGIFDAWNKGIAHAAGEWIYFMGADDRFASPTVLAEVAARLGALGDDVLVAYGRTNLVDAAGRRVQTLGGPWNPRLFRTLGMTIPHQGTFHRASLFRRYGLFDVHQGPTATYECLLRHLVDHDAAFLDGLVIGDMGLGGVSTRPENHLRFLNSYVAAQRRHGTFRPGARLAFAYAQALVKAGLFRALPYPLALEMVERARVMAGRPRHFARHPRTAG